MSEARVEIKLDAQPDATAEQIADAAYAAIRGLRESIRLTAVAEGIDPDVAARSLTVDVRAMRADTPTEKDAALLVAARVLGDERAEAAKLRRLHVAVRDASARFEHDHRCPAWGPSFPLPDAEGCDCGLREVTLALRALEGA